MLRQSCLQLCIGFTPRTLDDNYAESTGPHIRIRVFGSVFPFSVVAAIIFEIILLSRTFRQTIPSGNLYLKFYYYILPWMLSYIVAMIPILVYYIILLFTTSFVIGMTGLAAASSLEFLIAALLLIRKE